MTIVTSTICWVLVTCQPLFSPLFVNDFIQPSFFEQLLFIRCIWCGLIEFSQQLCEGANLTPIWQKRRLRVTKANQVPWARFPYSKGQSKNLNPVQSDNQANVYNHVHSTLPLIQLFVEDKQDLDKRRRVWILVWSKTWRQVDLDSGSLQGQFSPVQEAPLPDTVTLGIRVSAYEFWRDTFSPWPCPTYVSLWHK